MLNDPIVEEGRQLREQILSEFGGDLSKLMEHHRQMQPVSPTIIRY